MPQDMVDFSKCRLQVLWMPCGLNPVKVSPLIPRTPRTTNPVRQQSVRKPNTGQTNATRQDHSRMGSTTARGREKDADTHPWSSSATMRKNTLPSSAYRPIESVDMKC